MAAKRGLGKGLNSLIPEDSKVASEVKPKVVEKWSCKDTDLGIVLFFLRGFGFAHLFALLAGDGKFVFVPHIVLIGEGIEIIR